MKTSDTSGVVKRRIRKALADLATRHELLILRTIADLGKGHTYSIGYAVVAAAYEHVVADRVWARSRG